MNLEKEFSKVLYYLESLNLSIADLKQASKTGLLEVDTMNMDVFCASPGPLKRKAVSSKKKPVKKLELNVGSEAKSSVSVTSEDKDSSTEDVQNKDESPTSKSERHSSPGSPSKLVPSIHLSK